MMRKKVAGVIFREDAPGLWNRHVLPSLALFLRRSAAFAVDVTIAYLLLLVVEVPVFLYFFFYTDWVFKPDTPLKSALAQPHVLLLPIMLGIGVSHLFNGRSPGSRLMRIRMISVNHRLLSIVGCTLRFFVVFWTPYLFWNLIAFPYIVRHQVHGAYWVDLALSAGLILIWPVSIIWGNGTHGLHDMLMGTSVVGGKEQPSRVNGYSTHTGLRIIGVITNTAVASVVVVNLCIGMPVVRKWLSLTQPVAGHLEEGSYRLQSDELMTHISDRISALGMKKIVSEVRVAWHLRLRDPQQSRSVGTYAREGELDVPAVLLQVGGAGAKRMKPLTEDLLSAMHPVLAKYPAYTFAAERDLYYGIFGLNYIVEFEVDGEHAVGGEAWYPAFPMFGWSDCLRTIRMD